MENSKQQAAEILRQSAETLNAALYLRLSARQTAKIIRLRNALIDFAKKYETEAQADNQTEINFNEISENN